MAGTGREHDIMELEKQFFWERNPETKRNIRRTIQIIKNESALIGSMREKLLRAHREGDTDEIKDIHDYIKGKERYGQLGK